MKIAGNLITSCCGQHVPPASLGFSGQGKLQSHHGRSLTQELICVTLDSRSAPQIAQLNIKASKTDPFQHGVSIFLGKTGNRLCPVAALAAYLAIRGNQPGPFFQFRDGRPLSRERFAIKVREALTEAGLEASKFTGHSFRIGAATTAAARGVEDSLIKTLGRWESSAYVRIPRERLAGLSTVLSKQN